MAVELKLSKFDSTPWGFRLVGGADFDTPLTVIKVTEGSIAEESGMRVGDTVVRVNEVPTAPLSHAQAHELIKLSGNNFTLAVFRGVVGEEVREPKPLPVVPIVPLEIPVPESVVNPQTTQEETKEEVPQPGETPVLEISMPPGEALPEDLEIEEIQRSFEKEQTQDLKEFAQRFEHTMEQTTEQKIETRKTETKSQSLSVQAPRTGRSPSPGRRVRLEYSVKVEKNPKNDGLDDKWSSFMQKPKGPKPKSKDEMIKPKEPPYRVTISKIKRKLSKDYVEEKDKSLTAKAEVETSEEEYKTSENESRAKEESAEIVEESQEEQVEMQANETSAISEISASETNISSQQQVSVESTKIVEQTQQVSQTSMLQMQQLLQATQTSEYISETDLSMEEQLLRVQKQLLALSQLPAAIQQTLTAVTDQLSKIVKTDDQNPNQEQTANEENHNTNKSDGEDGNPGGENNPGADGNPGDGETEGGTDGEDNIPRIVEETDTSVNLDTDTNPESTPIPPTPSPEPVDNLTKEEREKIDKKVKTADEKEGKRQVIQELQLKANYKKPSFPSMPLQRPIVLPGGKKWYEPDDIIPKKINAKKYTDESIAETISSQSEIIVGTTLGESNCPLVPSKAEQAKRINFLKYKPEPPKSLDHLKHSEVYKMVHSLDLPTRGIAGRPSLVMAEEDLRSSLQAQSDENVSIQTPANLPAQMEP